LNNQLISVLTFLLGLVLGHWLAIGRDKRKEFNAAAERFYAHFLSTIQLLRAGSQDVFTIITPAVLKDQERAVIEFERFLPKSRQVRLNTAWSKYSSSPHTTAPGSLDKRPIDIASALANIEAMLKCASPR
jgi:hypothetical protein